MRLFTALDLPQSVRHQCARFREEMDLRARWIPPEQFHVTLRFIGETDPEQADLFKTALTTVRCPKPQCIPYGLDTLPSRNNPSVLVVALERTDSLMTLYEEITNALQTEGLPPEDRSYRPHVTLARLDNPNPKRVHDTLRDHDRSWDPFVPDAFSLYKSTLTPDGAVHKRLASVALST